VLVATITVRQLDDDVRDALRKRAADHGHSMEAEVRAILEAAVAPAERPQYGLASRIRARFDGLNLAELPDPDRSELPRAADFE
jgi:plasmid stability protein